MIKRTQQLCRSSATKEVKESKKNFFLTRCGKIGVVTESDFFDNGKGYFVGFAKIEIEE